MRGLLCLMCVALLATVMLSQNLYAQCQGGCNIATRAQQNPEPTPTPEELAAIRKEVEAVEKAGEWNAAEQRVPTVVATYRRPARQRDNLIRPIGLFDIANRYGSETPAATAADLAELRANIKRLEDRVADARARGERVPTMSEIRAEIFSNPSFRPEIDYNRVTAHVLQDPQFKQFVESVVNQVIRASAQARAEGKELSDLSIEIVEMDN